MKRVVVIGAGPPGAGQVLLEILKTPIFDLALRFGGLKPVRGVIHWVLAGA